MSESAASKKKWKLNRKYVKILSTLVLKSAATLQTKAAHSITSSFGIRSV
jgi:hypothetical protein